MSGLIRINKIHYPVTVLGPGKRIGIWLQGCSIRCKGCVSQDTWAADHRQNMQIDRLVTWCRQVTQEKFDGVTLSGGEPFDQAKELDALLIQLHSWRRQRIRAGGSDFDILCYSGYPFKTLQKRYPKILTRLDALIPEPYIDHLPLGKMGCGSSNQNLIALSERGEKTYAQWNTAPVVTNKRIQMTVEGERIFMIGIPEREDMEKLEALCQSRGLALNIVSWRR